MATTAEKIFLDSSVLGQPIDVSGTTTGLSTIHTGSTSTAVRDEIWIFANNNHSAALEVIVEYGSAANLQTYTVDARQGSELLIPGTLLGGQATALIINAHIGGLNGSASVAIGNVTISGYVNRLTTS